MRSPRRRARECYPVGHSCPSPACISGGCAVRATGDSPAAPAPPSGASRPARRQPRPPARGCPGASRATRHSCTGSCLSMISWRPGRSVSSIVFLRPLDLTVDNRHGQFHGRGGSSLLFLEQPAHVFHVLRCLSGGIAVLASTVACGGGT